MQIYPQEFRERGHNIAGFRPPGGESFTDLQQRVLPFFLTVLENLREHVLIVGHAGVNRVILCYLLGMPLNNLFRIGQDYGALNIITTEVEPFCIRTINIKPVAMDKCN